MSRFGVGDEAPEFWSEFAALQEGTPLWLRQGDCERDISVAMPTYRSQSGRRPGGPVSGWPSIGSECNLAPPKTPFRDPHGPMAGGLQVLEEVKGTRRPAPHFRRITLPVNRSR